jgi:hypothetical protein
MSCRSAQTLRLVLTAVRARHEIGEKSILEMDFLIANMKETLRVSTGAIIFKVRNEE